MITAAAQVVVVVKATAVSMIPDWLRIASDPRLRIADCKVPTMVVLSTPAQHVEKISDFPPTREIHICPKAYVVGQNALIIFLPPQSY